MALPELTAFLSGFEFEETLTLGDTLVAAGTLALAIFTAVLAWQTRGEVKASLDSIDLSSESIELTRRGIEIQDMPFVIAVPSPDQSRYFDATASPNFMWWVWEPQDEVYWLQLRLWNIGRGPAIARDIRLELGEDLLVARSGRVGELPIAPNGVHDINIRLYAEPPDGESVGTLRVYYAHSSGTEYLTWSEARIGKSGVRCANFSRRESDGQGRSVVDSADAVDV